MDVISALTESKNPNDYWYRLKTRMTDEEKSELSTKCRQLKLKSKDGKLRETDTLDTKGILRLIESVPSSKAEPFKLWLASLGNERINEVFDPEIAINRVVNYYRKKAIRMNGLKKDCLVLLIDSNLRIYGKMVTPSKTNGVCNANKRNL